MFVQFNDIRIIKDENYQKVPLSCDVCDTMLRVFDIMNYKKYECCDNCSLMIAHPNKEKWLNGWRPSRKEIDRVVENQNNTPIYIMRGL